MTSQDEIEQNPTTTEGTDNENEKEDEEEDLDAALDALDLDTNFLESSSFDMNNKDDNNNDANENEAPLVAEVGDDAIPTPAKSPSPPPSPQNNDELDWKDRDELYSRLYKPNPQERAQLEEIAKLLGVKSGLPGSGGGGGGLMDNLLGGSSHHGNNNGNHSDENDPHNPQAQWNRLVVGKSTPQQQKLPISILLKRGQVLYHEHNDDISNNDNDEKSSDTVAHHGCEFLLLTRGFLLAEHATTTKLFGKKQDILRPLGSALWTDVTLISTTPKSSLLLQCGKGKQAVKFEILPFADLTGWRTAIQTAAIQAHQHFDFDHKLHTRGWQYRLIHTPWFTEAVTGMMTEGEQGLEVTFETSGSGGSDEQESTTQTYLDTLDQYHGYAPLHYATRGNHTHVIRKLLEAGADPNVQDGEGKTPMYYAQRDELPMTTIAVLKEFGAVQSQKAEEEMRGELFGKVAETEKARQEKKEEQEAIAKAKAAEAEAVTNQMANNINAMHKRGEMIEELGTKATDLQDGAKDYADMASQLKEKLKKKSRWGF